MADLRGWAELQAEHAAWLGGRYDGMAPDVPLAGVLGECGEAQHALLSWEKAERHGPNPRHPDPAAELRDALGDACVYVVSWCNAAGRAAAELPWPGRPVWPPHKCRLTAGAALVREAAECFLLKGPSRRLLMMLDGHARALGADPLTLAWEAWSQVKGRAA